MRASSVLGLVIAFAACGGKVASAPSSEPTDRGGGSGEGEGSAASPAPSEPNPDIDPPRAPDPPSVPCTGSFSRDVMPAFERASCSALACHGGPSPPAMPMIDQADLHTTYEFFLVFRVSSGQPYIVPGVTDVYRHGMDCNLRGSCGALMPLGPDAPNPILLAIVDAWLACGAPYN